MYYCVYDVHDAREGLVSWPCCVEVRTIQQSKFSLSTFSWVLTIKLRSPIWNGMCLYFLGNLINALPYSLDLRSLIESRAHPFGWTNHLRISRAS